MEKATKKTVKKSQKPVKKVKKENKETKVVIEANGKKYEKTYNEKGDSVSIKEL